MNQFVEYANDEQEGSSPMTLEAWLANDRQDATDTLGEDIVAACEEVLNYE